MSDSTTWWVLAGGFVAIELFTGTIYLLFISLGMAAGAVSAHLGLSTSLQMAVAAAFGGGSVVIWRAYKKTHAPAAPASTMQEVSLDVGEIVHVDEWSADGTGSTRYRGCSWQVSLAPDEVATPGAYRIEEINGNRLILKKIK